MYYHQAYLFQSMKTMFTFAAFAAVTLLSQSGFTQSVPASINYQGQLTDATGKPLQAADYAMTFNIFDAAVAGSLVWGPQVFDGAAGEGHKPKVPVVQGYFNVILGPTDANGRSLSNSFATSSRFLEITVDNRTISPRQQILSAPFALNAGRAAESLNAVKLAGADWSEILTSGNDPRTAFIKATKLQPGGIGSDQLAPQSILSTHIASGQIGASAIADRSISTSKLALNSIDSTVVASGSIDFSRLAPRDARASGQGIIISESSGSFLTSSNDETPVTNSRIQVTTKGGALLISLVPSGSDTSFIGIVNPGDAQFRLYRDETRVGTHRITTTHTGGNDTLMPSSSIQYMDRPPAGTYNYELRVLKSVGPWVYVNGVSLLAVEY